MKPSTRISAPGTRLRLLEAAGEIFSTQGFARATVREICDKAGANVAAVNYHFGDKLALYVAVIKHWFVAAWEKYPPGGALSPGASAQDRLLTFIRSWLFRMMDHGAPAWHGRLVAREMADPTPGVIDAVIESHIGPHSQLLRSIVMELLGPDVPAQEVGLCVASIAGQCLFYFHCKDTIKKLGPKLHLSHDLDSMAHHIARFSLAGVEATRGAGGNRAKHNGPAPAPRRRAKERA
jgi:TetR/AcrR family transcriptional regulator, regulator of cefoperazone and chloramphenicol sensitivity